MILNIKNEFKNLIPPLTSEEFIQLEKNCIAEGIREKIIVWQNTIIDGHNRYEIANKNNLQFDILEKEFENENDVIEWIIYNQFGRRNINNYQRSVLALRLEDVFKAKAKENLILSGTLYGENHTKQEPCQKSDNPLDTIFEEIKPIKEKIEIKPIDTKKELSKIANVSHDTIAKVKKIEAVAPIEIKEKLQRNEISINEAYKEIKKEEKQELLETKKQEYQNRIVETKTNDKKIDIFQTEKKFRIIYADPAWSYNDKQDTSNLGGAIKHYDTMTTKEICNLPIKEISENNSVLFLWITSPLLPDGLQVIKEWGYEYKSMFIWDKVKHNMGHYNSVRHELLLIATKGSCVPDNKILYDSVQSIEKDNMHSKKPKEFIEIIEKLYIYGERIELFSRGNEFGNWYYWGNEV